MNSILVSVVLMLGLQFLHPIHITVTDIAYNEEEASLQVIVKVFVDDLENEIRQKLNEPYLDITLPTDGRTTDELTKAYLLENFKLEVNGKPVEWNYLGHKLSAESIHFYLEVQKVKKLKEIAVENTILLNFYEDQVNMVHVKVDGKLRSMKITPDRTKDSLTY